MTSAPIREAIAADDYVRAARLFEAYARSLRPEEAALAQLADLLAWTRALTRCSLAHMQARLQNTRTELSIMKAYRP